MKQLQGEQETKVLTGAFFKPNAFTQKKEKIKILETCIVNVLFEYEDDAEVYEFYQKFPPGTELFLYHEIDNEYDQWAVEIESDQKEKIGYITAFKNEAIARLLDAGKKINAVVLEESERENKEYTAFTEKGLPIAVYMED